MPDTYVVGVGGGTGPAATANFDRTVTALVNATVEENLRKVVRYLAAGGFRSARLVAGTNLVRYISYGDLSVPSPLLPPV
jgi:hypothetical protein